MAFINKQPFIETLLAEYRQAKVALVEAQAQAADAESALLREWTGTPDLSGQKTLSFTDKRKTFTATLVSSQTVAYDEDALIESLPRDVVERITKLVVDKEALEAAVSVGLVSIDDVTAHATVKQRKPHVRFKEEF